MEELKKYRELIKQYNVIQKEISDLETLVAHTKNKRDKFSEKVDTLEKEIKASNEKYEDLMKKKLEILTNILAFIASIILLVITKIPFDMLSSVIELNSIIAYIIPFLMIISIGVATCGAFVAILTLYNLIFRDEKNIFKRLLNKSKVFKNLLREIKSNENILSITLEEFNKLNEEYNNADSKLKEKKEEFSTIEKEINQQKINYATPIFEQGLIDAEDENLEQIKPLQRILKKPVNINTANETSNNI